MLRLASKISCFQRLASALPTKEIKRRHILKKKKKKCPRHWRVFFFFVHFYTQYLRCCLQPKSDALDCKMHKRPHNTAKSFWGRTRKKRKKFSLYGLCSKDLYETAVGTLQECSTYLVGPPNLEPTAQQIHPKVIEIRNLPIISFKCVTRANFRLNWVLLLSTCIFNIYLK